MCSFLSPHPICQQLSSQQQAGGINQLVINDEYMSCLACFFLHKSRMSLLALHIPDQMCVLWVMRQLCHFTPAAVSSQGYGWWIWRRKKKKKKTKNYIYRHFSCCLTRSKEKVCPQCQKWMKMIEFGGIWLFWANFFRWKMYTLYHSRTDKLFMHIGGL